MKRYTKPTVVAVFLVLFAAIGLARDPQSVVVWLSIDALRGDYADKVDTPTLRQLMKEGVYSKRLTGTYPTLTFPSHTSLATGVTPGVHGVVGNTFYDKPSGQTYNMPGDGTMMLAEPIWVTAARQGVRSVVLDWPMSYNQQGPYHSAVYGARFDGTLNAAQRFDNMLNAWSKDNDATPMRLLISYAAEVDHDGHSFGPDSPQVADALKYVDGQIAHVRDRAVELFKAKMEEQDHLYLVITGDHGMMPIHTNVNWKHFLGELPDGVRVVEGGSALQIFCLKGDGEAKRAALDAIATKAKDMPGSYMLRQSEYPADWNYVNPQRTADALILAKPGYNFSGRMNVATTRPTGMVATHGYVPEECPEMQAMLIIWEYNHSLGGKDLGKVSQLALHPTVGKLLGISPAPMARERPVAVDEAK